MCVTQLGAMGGDPQRPLHENENEASGALGTPEPSRHNSWYILSRNLALFCPGPEILCQAKSKYKELIFGRGNFQIEQLGYNMASAFCSYPEFQWNEAKYWAKHKCKKKMHFCEEERKFKVTTNRDAKERL